MKAKYIQPSLRVRHVMHHKLLAGSPDGRNKYVQTDNDENNFIEVLSFDNTGSNKISNNDQVW